MDIKNSSGKIIGNIKELDGGYLITNPPKPDLLIDDKEIISKIKSKDETAFTILWNDYTLLIGEIAALYGMVYATTRKHL